jgi:hypothetical protein
MLGGMLHTIKRNTKSLSIVSKEVGQEVNGNKTKYLVISRGQDSERNFNKKIVTNNFESSGVEIQEEIKSILK